MAATPKPVRREMKKDMNANRVRIKKAEKTKSIAPKAVRKAADKKLDHKERKKQLKHSIESTMKNRKDTAGMRGRPNY